MSNIFHSIIILPPSSHETKDTIVCVCLCLEWCNIGIEKIRFTTPDKKINALLSEIHLHDGQRGGTVRRESSPSKQPLLMKTTLAPLLQLLVIITQLFSPGSPACPSRRPPPLPPPPTSAPSTTMPLPLPTSPLAWGPGTSIGCWPHPPGRSWVGTSGEGEEGSGSPVEEEGGRPISRRGQKRQFLANSHSFKNAIPYYLQVFLRSERIHGHLRGGALRYR